MGNDVIAWWSHRGCNQQFLINQNNTLSPVAACDKVIGTDVNHTLVLVDKNDAHKQLVFKDLYHKVLGHHSIFK